jgi:hypothetical protein
MSDTLEFVKNLWGSMGVPGMSLPGLAAPTLSLNDLDKKLADLKAVEAWLNLNVAMLRGTIQALEVQRGTIATLKSMGASMAEAMSQPGADQKSILAASPFSAFFNAPGAETAKPASAKPEAAKESGAAEPPAGAGAAASPFMPDPTLWWNLLQDQFQQALGSALGPEAMQNATAMAQQAAAAATGKRADQAKPADNGAGAGTAAGGGGGATKPRAPKSKVDKG